MKRWFLVLLLMLPILSSCGSNNGLENKTENDGYNQEVNEANKEKNNTRKEESITREDDFIEKFQNSYILPREFGRYKTAIEVLESQSKNVIIKQENGGTYNISCECKLANGEISKETSGTVTVNFMFDPGVNVAIPIEMYDGQELLAPRYMQEYMCYFEDEDSETVVEELVGLDVQEEDINLECSWWDGKLGAAEHNSSTPEAIEYKERCMADNGRYPYELWGRSCADDHTSLTCKIVEKMDEYNWYKALYLNENAQFENQIIISSLKSLKTGDDVYTIYGWIIGGPNTDDESMKETPVVWLNYYDDGDVWKDYDGPGRPNIDYDYVETEEDYEVDSLDEEDQDIDEYYDSDDEYEKDDVDRIVGTWESDGKGKFYIHVEKVSDRTYSIRVDHDDPNDWWEFSATYNDNKDIYPMKGKNHTFGMEFDKEGYLYFVGDYLYWYEEREDGSMEGFPNSATFTKVSD